MAKSNVVPIDDGKLQTTIPDFLRDAVKEDAGKGVSTAARDNLVPLIYVLDAKSPQVDKGDARYIEGAGAGDLYLRNFAHPIVSGKDGILFQPCHFTKDWVEWVPRSRGGGYAGRHQWNNSFEDGHPKEAVQKPSDENPRKMIWVLPNGNEVKETRYHAGYVMIDGGAFPFVIPFSSTGHTVSKNWMFAMMSRVNEEGKPVPSYACLYRLKTRQRINASGKWYVIDPQFEGFVKTADDYKRGKDLNIAFETGAKEIEEEHDVSSPSDDVM